MATGQSDRCILSPLPEAPSSQVALACVKLTTKRPKLTSMELKLARMVVKRALGLSLVPSAHHWDYELLTTSGSHILVFVSHVLLRLSHLLNPGRTPWLSS